MSVKLKDMRRCLIDELGSQSKWLNKFCKPQFCLQQFSIFKKMQACGKTIRTFFIEYTISLHTNICLVNYLVFKESLFRFLISKIGKTDFCTLVLGVVSSKNPTCPIIFKHLWGALIKEPPSCLRSMLGIAKVRGRVLVAVDSLHVLRLLLSCWT